MFFLVLLYAAVGWADPCNPLLLAGDLCSIRIDEILPTQGAVGMLDVAEKRNLIKSQRHLKKFLKEEANRLKVVIGPGGKYYLIDRHHLSLALKKEDIKGAYALIMENFSDLSESEFWSVMKEKGWARFKDEMGNSIDKLPTKLSQLKDDPYRSLAWVVRNSGAYEKTNTPFSEFFWADHFRKFFSLKELKVDWSGCVRKSIEMAVSNEMHAFPGYVAETPKGQGQKIKDCMENYRKLKFRKL